MGLAECSLLASGLRNNESLLTLNLNGNCFGDEGARVLSRGLLANKKLAALSMQGRVRRISYSEGSIGIKIISIYISKD